MWIAAGSVIVVAVAVGAGFAFGRASGDEEPPSPSISADPTGATGTTGPTGPSGSPSPEPSPTEAPTPAIEDGRHFTFLSAIDTGDPTTVTFDLAYFYTGEEAAEVAAERGDESPPPNDYYIVNDNPRLRTVPVADDAELRILDWANCCEGFITGSIDELAAAMEADDDPYGGPYRYTSPFWLTVEDGQIVLIEEQYLP
jgi:hypothetical protein